MRLYITLLLVGAFWLGLMVLRLADQAFSQQSPTPCEEVRGNLATNFAERVTKVVELERENFGLKAKLAEMEKKQGNGKDATPTPSK